jgi:hypothetical protein
MRKISAYFFSVFIIASGFNVRAQDSIKVPLNIRLGFDVTGPVGYFIDRNNMNIEGFLSIDRSAKKAIVLETGYQKFSYSQYNYSYLSSGVFFRGGIDFNTIHPFIAQGKYYAGLGLRYGLSIFRYEVPSFSIENYWGTGNGSIPSSLHAAHFIEVSPGIKTELFKNVSIGWNLRLRLMVYAGTGKDFKPVSVPGFGNGVKSFSPGMNYHIMINIPYRSVFVKPEPEKIEEPETEPVKK